MFNLNRETELTPDLLYKMISKYHSNVLPKLQKYKNYYDGTQAILRKSYADESKPCNRVVTNYCADIVSSYCGYIASPGYISYSSDNDIDSIMDCLRYNDYQDEDSDFLNAALIYGVAAELMYTDEQGKVRFRLIEPTSCFGVYDDCLTQELTHFVRWYKTNDWDNSDLYNVDVYSDTSIKHYQMHGTQGGLEFVSEESHYFNQCPANIFYLDKDERSIFECIITLQDAYNELLSGEIDDFSAFCDAYLTLEGVDAEEEDIAAMKANRVLILPSGATADWLTKNASDTQIENILKRVHDNIYRIAKCPDFSSETFVGGVSSGIAIRYRLTGCETKAAAIESNMKKALQRRIELIAGVASLTLGEEVYRDIQITFKRNIPEDYTSIVNIVNALKGTVSDETLLSMIPQVTDVKAELDRVQEQKQKNMELYNFGSNQEE
jgi:SPP1 family phage portal protein|nr:MAG TPA: PORTAL PROTEIN [Caudoviricetes sp.]